MGDIADDMINGNFDFYTGEYIGEGHGIPRTHNKSLPWERDLRLSRRNNNLSWRKVPEYLESIGIKQHLHPQVVKDYGCVYKGKRPLQKACYQVLKGDGEKFKEFAQQWKESNL